MKTELIQVEYTLEVWLGHEGMLSRAYDVPSIVFPIDIAWNT